VGLVQVDGLKIFSLDDKAVHKTSRVSDNRAHSYDTSRNAKK